MSQSLRISSAWIIGPILDPYFSNNTLGGIKNQQPPPPSLIPLGEVSYMGQLIPLGHPQSGGDNLGTSQWKA